MDIDAILGPAVTFVLGGGLVGVIINWRLQRHKPKVESDAGAVTNFDTFSARVMADNTRLRDDLDILRAEMNDRIDERVQAAEDRLERKHERQMTELRQRYEDMDHEMHKVRRALTAARAYVNELLTGWRLHIPHIDPPSPPADYADTH